MSATPMGTFFDLVSNGKRVLISVVYAESWIYRYFASTTYIVKCSFGRRLWTTPHATSRKMISWFYNLLSWWIRRETVSVWWM